MIEYPPFIHILKLLTQYKYHWGEKTPLLPKNGISLPKVVTLEKAS